MSTSRVRWAADTEVIRRLESEWCEIAKSPRLCERLREWATEDPRLAFENGTELVRAAQSREVSCWSERDRVLDALLERFEDDPLARAKNTSLAFLRKPNSGRRSLKRTGNSAHM